MATDIDQSVQILQAYPADMAEIFDLQRVAYLSEAQLFNNYAIQPLTQTLEQALAEFHRFVVFKAVRQERIIGSVRVYESQNTGYINKLIVQPDCQNQGIGKRLMQFAESFFAGKRCELFTAARSWKNLALYKKLGYTVYREKADATGFVFAFLAKTIQALAPAIDHPDHKKQKPGGVVFSSVTFPESPEAQFKRLLREKGGRPRQMEPHAG